MVPALLPDMVGGHRRSAGSGVVEVGCKIVVSQCLQRSDMRWTLGRASALLALRSCPFSGGWEAFWEHRLGLTCEVAIRVVLYTRQAVKRPLSRPLLDCRVIGYRRVVQHQVEVQVSRRLQSERRREG